MERTFRTALTVAWVTVAGTCFLPQAARAGNLFIKSPVIATPIKDPVFQYSFQLYLDGGLTGARLEKNDFLTVYDVPLMDPGTNSQLNPDGTVSALWKATFNYLGEAPPGYPSPNNCDQPYDPAHPELYNNVTWAYRGADAIVAAIGQQILLGTFFISTTDDATLLDIPSFLCFGDQTTLPDGTKVGHTGTVAVRVVPEPSSVVLMGLGCVFGALGLRSRTRSRRRARSNSGLVDSAA